MAESKPRRSKRELAYMVAFLSSTREAADKLPKGSTATPERERHSAPSLAIADYRGTVFIQRSKEQQRGNPNGQRDPEGQHLD